MHIPADEKPNTRKAHLDAFAGAFAGGVARFIVGPLDVIKIRFQVQLEPIRQSAMQAGSSTLSMPSHYTGFVNAFKTILKEEGVPVGAAFAVKCQCSIWACACQCGRARRGMLRHARVLGGMSADAAQVVHAACASMQGLWRGTVPGLLLTVPYTAVQFLALQQCKDAAVTFGWTGVCGPAG